MKITLEFNSWDELMEWKGAKAKETPKAKKAEAPEPVKAEIMPAPDPKPAKVEEPAKAEEEKPAPAPQYALADAQKAIREVVKKKGKDAAKAVLGKFPSKDNKDVPASSASTLRAEDYPEAIRMLQEVLNA